MHDSENIIRVFPRKTNATPNDDMAFVGDPPFLAFLPNADEVHVSCTFTWDRLKSERIREAWEQYYPGKVKLGGPAYDDRASEFVPGRYLKKGYVITSRGCPNKCPWCCVPQREGKLRCLAVRDGYNVLDNNLLAAGKGHIEAVFDMLRRQKRAAKFTGGLDASILTDWHIEMLKSIKVRRIFLAYDHQFQFEDVESAAQRLQAAGFDREKLACYVLVGWGGDTIQKAERRMEKVWEWGMMPFAMLFQSSGEKKSYYTRDWQKLTKQWTRPAFIKARHRQVV